MELLPLWVEFFDELRNVRGRSENTVMAYRRDLELFCEYYQKNKSIMGFYEYMRKQKLSERSQARVISSLRTYFKYREECGVKSPELRELKLPKVKAALPRGLTTDEFNRLFAACETPSEVKTARNRLVLLLLFGLGCRVTELIGLNLNDFHETERWIKILGKGNKERLVPLTERLCEDLNFYLLHIRPQLIHENKAAIYSILINDKGSRPSRVDVWRWLDAWSARAGFEQTISPHQFRHGCATTLLESGADLRSIQILLGHSSIQTTQIYTSVTSNTMSQAIENHHPLAKMKE